MMTRIRWISILLATVFSATNAVDRCRCETEHENYYERRRQTQELQQELSSISVHIDNRGYYLVDGVRVLPPAECPHPKSRGGETMFSISTLFSHRRRGLSGTPFDNLFVPSGGGLRGQQASSPATFACDSQVVATPPALTGVPVSIEEYILQEYSKPRFIMDLASGELKRETRTVPFQHTRSDGSKFLVESELDCSTLPLSVRMNRQALPFHCKCPSHVPISLLPSECFM